MVEWLNAGGWVGGNPLFCQLAIHALYTLQTLVCHSVHWAGLGFFTLIIRYRPTGSQTLDCQYALLINADPGMTDDEGKCESIWEDNFEFQVGKVQGKSQLSIVTGQNTWSPYISLAIPLYPSS